MHPTVQTDCVSVSAGCVLSSALLSTHCCLQVEYGKCVGLKNSASRADHAATARGGARHAPSCLIASGCWHSTCNRRTTRCTACCCSRSAARCVITGVLGHAAAQPLEQVLQGTGKGALKSRSPFLSFFCLSPQQRCVMPQQPDLMPLPHPVVLCFAAALGNTARNTGMHQDSVRQCLPGRGHHTPVGCAATGAISVGRAGCARHCPVDALPAVT